MLTFILFMFVLPAFIILLAYVLAFRNEGDR